MLAKRKPMADQFYIVSLKWSEKSDGLITLWGPDNSGYVYRIERAGRYSAPDVKASAFYYNNGANTMAVPCEVIDALTIPVSESKSHKIDRGQQQTDRVIPWRHLRKLKQKCLARGAA